MNRTHKSTSIRSISTPLLLLWICTIVLSLPGCNIVGPASYVIGGPPKADAEYVLQDIPTVVFLDDRDNKIQGSVNLRRIIADTASQSLLDQKLVTKVISSNDAMAMATQHERSSKVLSIEDIGNLVGARQIIYVQMEQFQNSADGFTPRPIAACTVRVIDLDRRERVYPAADSPSGARIVHVVGRAVDPAVFQSRATRDKVYEGLAMELGQQIAYLFYRHEIKELGGNLNPL